MSPIRVAIIGLSAAATGTGWAASAHLPYLLKSPHYKIVALCNTSLENAYTAIKAYDLGPETRAYGSPEDLAKDSDVDLVVANTRVDLHGKVLLPSIKAGKNVFSEWPMDSNEAKAKVMLDAARQSGSKTIVGLQGRANPAVQKLKQVIEEGRIGKVLSSTFYTCTTNGGAEESAKVKYITQREVGGNILTIHFGHTVDWFLYILGEISTVQTQLATQLPEVRIIDDWNTRNYVETIKKDTPDEIMLQARLATGPVVSMHLRGGRPPPLEPNCLWRIFGSKGEIDVESDSLMLNVKTEGVKLRLHDQETGEVEEITVDKDGLEDLPQPAQNIGRVYEAFAKGDPKGVLVSFEDAFRRHVIIEKMLEHWDNGDQGWKL